jgi:hypothetical protein
LHCLLIGVHSRGVVLKDRVKIDPVPPELGQILIPLIRERLTKSEARLIVKKVLFGFVFQEFPKTDKSDHPVMPAAERLV